MKILVTGAAGFIGSNLTDKLLSEGHTVVGLDNFDPFYAREIKEQNLSEAKKHPSFTLVEADIRLPETFEKLLSISTKIPTTPETSNTIPSSDFDAIIHLAAKPGVRPSIEDPIGFQETNVKGTQNVLEFARKAKIKQFIFASSSSVYGINPRVPWKEDDTVLMPISPYASTKISGELMGHVYSHLYGIRFLALRFFTVYGPRQRPDLAIHKFAKEMLTGGTIPLYGDGTTSRDYTYIDDVAQGIANCLYYNQSMFEIINIGNNQTVALTKLVNEMEQATGVLANIRWLPNQMGDVPHTCASIEKASSILKYTPNTPIKQGILKFINWLKNSPSSFRPLQSTLLP